MLQPRRDAIRQNSLQLVREMAPRLIVYRLKELNALTDMQCENILAKSTKSGKNNAILDMIQRRGLDAYKKFCQSLSASGGHHLRCIVDMDWPRWPLSESTCLLLVESGIAFQHWSCSVEISFQA